MGYFVNLGSITQHGRWLRDDKHCGTYNEQEAAEFSTLPQARNALRKAVRDGIAFSDRPGLGIYTISWAEPVPVPTRVE